MTFWKIYREILGVFLAILVTFAAFMGLLYLLIEVLALWQSVFVLLGVIPATIAGGLAYLERNNE